MRELTQILSVRTFLTIGSYEKDPGFKELLRSVAQQGLLLYGVLGAVIVTVYVLAHTLLIGKTISWSYVGLDSQVHILLFDKTLIFLLCVAMIPLSRRSISLNWIRGLIFILIWLICMAMLIEDIAMQDVSFTTAYTSVALLIAVATVPYKGWQTGLFSFGVIGSTIAAVSFVPSLAGMGALELKLSQVIFICVIAVILTGMSSQIYLNRYKQYRAWKESEKLKAQLEERADILKKLNEKTEQQARRILKNEKLKDRFFANISHEFRTPLTLILGPLKDLLDGNEPKKRTVDAALLGMMYSNGNRLLQLINQLLDLSKIDSGNMQLELRTVDLGAMVEETVRSFAPMAERAGVDLSCAVDHTPLISRIDPLQMEQVITNLLSNALKFTPEGGSVEVTVKEDTPRDSIRITVADTGIGIPPDDLPYVFDRFYRAAQTPGRFGEGTGIGLALVKEIMNLHGGSVQVNSREGSGTEFVISLVGSRGSEGESPSLQDSETTPYEIKADEWAWADEEVPVYPAEDAHSVLLVDDNPDILAYLATKLSTSYRVETKKNGASALELIRQKRFDLIISDVMMPAPDGFELCRTIKETPELSDIPVILLTAQAAEESRLEGLELGADDYISKPFSASELMVRVENLIELRRMLRRKFSREVRLAGEEVEVSSEDARFLEQVQSVIGEHMGNSNFGIDWLADEMNLSTRQLQRRIRSITRLSAGGYLRMLRLERAGQLLEQNWGNVSDISSAVGFRDSKYFSQLFKQTFGVNPSEYSGKEP